MTEAETIESESREEDKKHQVFLVVKSYCSEKKST